MAKLVIRKPPAPRSQALRKLPTPTPATTRTMQLLADRFGFEEDDRYIKIEGTPKFMSVHVEKSDGKVLSQKFMVGKRLKITTAYDKNDFTVDERREAVGAMKSLGFSQAQIADQLGFSQPTISLDLKYLRQAKAKPISRKKSN